MKNDEGIIPILQLRRENYCGLSQPVVESGAILAWSKKAKIVSSGFFFTS